MLGELKTFEGRKRAAPQPLFVEDFSQKENVIIIPGKFRKNSKNRQRKTDYFFKSPTTFATA